MNEIQKYSALKLPWEQVSRYVGSMVSAILEQDITCTTKGEDDNYWSVAAEDYRFTNVEIVRLVKAVEGNEHMLSHGKPIQECLGGASAEKLAQYGKPRPDGKSLSRVARLLAAQKTDFLITASSGPGDKDVTGLIVPRYGGFYRVEFQHNECSSLSVATFFPFYDNSKYQHKFF